MTAGATLWQIVINYWHPPQILSQTKAAAWHGIQMMMMMMVWLALHYICLILGLCVCVRECVWSLGKPGPVSSATGPYILWSAPMLNNLIISQWLPCIIYTAKGDNAKARAHLRLLCSLLCPCVFCLFVKEAPYSSSCMKLLVDHVWKYLYETPCTQTRFPIWVFIKRGYVVPISRTIQLASCM